MELEKEEGKDHKTTIVTHIEGLAYFQKEISDSTRLFGTIQPQATYLSMVSNARSTVLLTLFTSHFALSQVEELRYEKAFIKLKLHLTSLRGDTTELKDTFIKTESIWIPSENSYEIARSDWIDLLKEVGYSENILFELPVPKLNILSPDVIEHLNNARRLFLLGEPMEVMTNCRKAIDKTLKIINSMKGSFIENIDLGSTPDENYPNKSERFFKMVHKAKLFCSMGPHDGFQINRRDAELALHWTITTVRYAFQIIHEMEQSRKSAM